MPPAGQDRQVRGVLLSSDVSGASDVQLYGATAEPGSTLMYVAGRAAGRMTVGPSMVDLPSAQTIVAAVDSADGTGRWVVSLGTSQQVRLAALHNGGVLAVFPLDGAVTVFGTMHMPTSGADILAVAINGDGTRRWARQLSHGTTDGAAQVAATADGGAVVVFSAASVQPDSGLQPCGLAGARLDNAGAVSWQECLIQTTGTSFIAADGLTHDGAQGVFYVSGFPVGELTYGTVQTGTPVNAAYGGSYLMQVAASTGAVQWVRFFQRAYARSLFVDGQGQLVTVGSVPSMGTPEVPVLLAGTPVQRCEESPTFHTSAVSFLGALVSTRLIQQTQVFAVAGELRAFVDLEQHIRVVDATSARWIQRVAGTATAWQPNALQFLSNELVAVGHTSESLTLATQSLTPATPGQHGVLVWLTL